MQGHKQLLALIAAWMDTRPIGLCGFNEIANEHMHRVALEDQQWKIVILWDDVLRNEGLAGS